MAEKRLAKHKKKKGLRTLISEHREDYMIDDPAAVELMGVWDIINDSGDALVENICGTKEAITRLAQEVFGFDPESPRWIIQSATVNIDDLLDAEALLEEFEIPKEPIYENEVPASK